MDADQIRSLQPVMAAFASDFRDCFKREATFEHFQRYLLGLQTELDRKSIEPIALAAGELKYFISNAPANASLESMLKAAFARWHIEKWFERAKQLAGFGAFEVRNHTSLIRHWLCSRLAMLFLAEQTHRLRGEKSEDHIGTGRRSGQHAGVEVLESHLAVLG